MSQVKDESEGDSEMKGEDLKGVRREGRKHTRASANRVQVRTHDDDAIGVACLCVRQEVRRFDLCDFCANFHVSLV